MILIYPALVSETIPQEMMPAVCKLLERYLIVYHWDSQIARARKMSRKEFEKGMEYLFEDKDIIDMFGSDYMTLSESEFNKKYKEILTEASKEKPGDIYDKARKNSPLGKEREKSGPPESITVPYQIPDPNNPRQTITVYSRSGVPDKTDDASQYFRDPYNLSGAKPAPGHFPPKAEESLRELLRQREEILRGRAEHKQQMLANINRQIDTLLRRRKDAATVDVSSVNLSVDMTLEPTYINITLADGSMLVAVKVVPFYLDTNVTLAELLLNDRKLVGIKAKITKYTRILHKRFLKLYYRTLGRIPLMPGQPGTITGDPYKDIILSSTNFGKRIFAVLDKNDIQNEFFQSAGGIKKLFGLGWNNLVFIDDINKRGIFCMKKFNGLCSTIPFPTMFSSLGGRENLYNSLEQARTSTSAFFRARKSPSGLFNESQNLIDNKLQEFRKLTPDSEILNEDMESFMSSIKKLKMNLIIPQLKSIAKSGDHSALIKLAEKNKIKVSSIDSLYKIGSKYNKDFVKSYSYAYKVINNSIEDQNEIIKKSLATFIAGVSSAAAIKNGTNILDETKSTIKETLSKILDILQTLSSNPEALKSITKIVIGIVIVKGLVEIGPATILIGLAVASIVIMFLAWTGSLRDKDSF